MPPSHPKRGVVLLISLLITHLSLLAATPQEDAFLKVWSVHVRGPQDHKAVIDACQSVMDKSSTLGEYLPAVKTLAAWHLLAAGKQADAVRIFESALLTSDKAAPPIARYADALARRWLTRIDHGTIEKALKGYYADNVEYPSSLAPLLNLPKEKAPPKSDRFGDAWIYKCEAFSKLTQLKNQRYSLYSQKIGNKLTRLSALPFDAYGKKGAFIVARKSSTPLTVEFETVTETGAQRAVATESGLINGIRFLRLDSDNRFALMIDSEGDYWVVAPPARSR
jgi:hypothetical protein